jgi:TPR repeat protein
VALLAGFLVFACARGALAETEPAPEPTDVEAQFELGMRLAWGLEGTRKDQRAALKWFHLAAEQGHSRAQTQLGMAYQQGRGTERDFYESVKWMRKSAEQGHPKAQFEMGVYYRDGKGVQRDKVLGLMWLLLSQQKGGIASRIVAPALARGLKPRDRSEAWELVYQWREAHGLPRIPPRAAKSETKATTPAEPAPGSETSADSEPAPEPQDGATPAEAPPQEGDAPASG